MLAVPSGHGCASPGTGDPSKPCSPSLSDPPGNSGAGVPRRAWLMPPLHAGLVIATITLPDNSPAFGFTAQRHPRRAPAPLSGQRARAPPLPYTLFSLFCVKPHSGR